MKSNDDDELMVCILGNALSVSTSNHPNRRVGSINDIDPVNGVYGSLSMEQQMQQQQQQQYAEMMRRQHIQQQQQAQMQQQQQQQQARSQKYVRTIIWTIKLN